MAEKQILDLNLNFIKQSRRLLDLQGAVRVHTLRERLFRAGWVRERNMHAPTAFEISPTTRKKMNRHTLETEPKNVCTMYFIAEHKDMRSMPKNLNDHVVFTS